MKFDYKYDYQRQARAALGLLKKKLDGLAETGRKLGEIRSAELVEKNAKTIEAYLEQREMPEPATAAPALRPYLRQGFELLAHNFTAAAGTVTALGRPEIAEDFKAEGQAIASVLVPLLDEQIGLSLVEAKEKKK